MYVYMYTRTLRNLMRRLQHQNMKSSTVVLSNSGHDHLLILRFPSEEVALSVRGRSNRLGHPRFACVKGDVFQEVCAAFFRRIIRFFCICFNSVGIGTKDTRKSNRMTSVADRVARGPHNTSYTTRMVSMILPVEEPMI